LQPLRWRGLDSKFQFRNITSGCEVSVGLGQIGRRRDGIIQPVVGFGKPVELFRRLEEQLLKPDEGAQAVGGGEASRN
jgi:hypothetical protein